MARDAAGGVGCVGEGRAGCRRAKFADAVSLLVEMAWSEPEHSLGDVDHAGDILIDDAAPQDDWDYALEVVNNWRSAHSFPLNTFQMRLRANAGTVDPRSLVAQRIKRFSSIDAKLRRFKWLKLSAMQDIGGCRAVVSSARRVQELVKLYDESRNLRHELIDRDDRERTRSWSLSTPYVRCGARTRTTSSIRVCSSRP